MFSPVIFPSGWVFQWRLQAGHFSSWCSRDKTESVALISLCSGPPSLSGLQSCWCWALSVFTPFLKVWSSCSKVQGEVSSTRKLVKSLFSAYIYCLKPSERLKPTVAVETNTVLLRDNLKLTIVDTPSFGDAVDNSNCWKPILANLGIQFGTVDKTNAAEDSSNKSEEHH